MRWVALLLLAPAPALAQDQRATVYVENATAAADLLALLREEMPTDAFAETASLADLRANLSDALRLVIADRYGITMLDRALEGGRDAAVRVAALLIVEARDSWRGAAPPIAPLVAKPVLTATRAWSVGASAGVGFGMWQTGSRALLAYSASAYFGIWDFEIGASFSIAGAGCACSVRTEALRVEPEAIAIVALGRWIFWRPLDWIETSVWIAGGYQRERVESRVIGGFASDGPLETLTYEGFVARGGVAIGMRAFDLLRVRVDFGAQVLPQAAVSLPDFDEYRGVEGAVVRRGIAMPWGMLSFGVAL